MPQGRDQRGGQRRDRFRQIGAADRQRLEGWQGLMGDLGVTPPDSVQRYLDNPEQRVRRGAARRGVVGAPPQTTRPGINESAYTTMLASMGGGAAPAGAMTYRDYGLADDFARIGNVSDPAMAARYTVPTQINGVPNVIPSGARITYEGYTPGYQQPTPPAGQPPTQPPPQPNPIRQKLTRPLPPLSQATRQPQWQQTNRQQLNRGRR